MIKKLCNFIQNKRVNEIEKTTVIVSLIIFLYFITIGINLPFVGPNATNFNVYSLIAHNFNKFGYLETKFAPVISVSSVLPEKPVYFFHHPTLLSFVESVLYKIFGENFWVGRFTVIIFAFGSLILTYYIGKKLINRKYGVIAIFVTAIIPASTLFGKMIGQEPLVLFFCLLALYSVLMYLSSENKKYLILCLIAIVLGVFSDWPMVYFIFFFIPLFAKYKKTRIGIYFVIFSLSILTILLAYVYFMESGFWDLQNALALRSINGLLRISLWPILWIATLFLRFIIYFNPIIFLFSIIALYQICIRYIKKQLIDADLVIIGLFLFSIFHFIFYAQASFTHPYLIYYLLPFITFGSSRVILNLLQKKQYVYPIIIISFSMFYLFFISMYKRDQVLSNLWRYGLTSSVNEFLIPYERVLMNSSTVINTDLLWYSFSISTDIADENTSIYNIDKYHHYIFSCLEKCNQNDIQLSELKKRYSFYYISESHAEAYVFILKQEKNQKVNEKHKGLLKSINISKNPDYDTKDLQIARRIYRWLMNVLSVPQI